MLSAEHASCGPGLFCQKLRGWLQRQLPSAPPNPAGCWHLIVLPRTTALLGKGPCEPVLLIRRPRRPRALGPTLI